MQQRDEQLEKQRIQHLVEDAVNFRREPATKEQLLWCAGLLGTLQVVLQVMGHLVR